MKSPSIISFYPGPSRIYPKMAEYFQDGYEQGIFSLHHRSNEFMNLFKELKILFKTKLSIPDNYELVFVSSATECWEIIAHSFIKEKSLHFFNGSFGEKWMKHTEKLTNDTVSFYEFGIEEELPIHLYTKDKYDIVCITQNETSNGTEVNTSLIQQMKKKHPYTLIAVDATSSLGAIKMPIESADIWFASVQKGLGLPPGMAVLILSPNAIAQSYIINNKKNYNNASCLIENSQKNQTHITPNITNIYLLYRILKDIPSLENIHTKTIERVEYWIHFFQKQNFFYPLIQNKNVLSKTVFVLKADTKKIETFKKLIGVSPFRVGNGYGKWKDTSIRIANFPAITDEEIFLFSSFLQKNIVLGE